MVLETRHLTVSHKQSGMINCILEFLLIIQPNVGVLIDIKACVCFFDKVVETMTFNSFRQEAWNDRVVEIMVFNSFRQEPGMIVL